VVCTCRAILDQKIELMMAETGEQLARYAPQLAALV
jgi:bacterioferritin-associated ferredoxin